MNIRFIPLGEEHIGEMFLWLNNEKVSAWYGKDENYRSFDRVKEKYIPRTESDSKTKSFIIQWAGKDLGYIQTYRITDYPEYNRFVETDDQSAGLDLFIGDDDFRHKGYGPIIITRFLEEVVFNIPGITRCVIGPDPQNRAAIKAYEKAGFLYWKTVRASSEEEQEYLMVIEKKGTPVPDSAMERDTPKNQDRIEKARPGLARKIRFQSSSEIPCSRA